MNVKKDILLRVYISFMLVVLLAVAIVAQMFRLQTVKRTALKQMADSLTLSIENIQPIRGNIYAADGSLLSTSIPIYETRMDMKAEGLTKDLWKENIDSLAWCLANYFKDKTEAEWKKDLVKARKKGNRAFLIHRKLSHTQIKDIKKFPLFRLGRYKSGLVAEQKSKRILPFSKLGQRTIGYIREDVKPVGIEGAFNEYLAGKEGKRMMQRVSGGVKVPIKEENEIEPQDGLDIITTLDVNFQDITETALEKSLIENNAAFGCAIVMEVSTGHIKAIANLSREGEGTYIEKYNYAIGESTEPGSTFKLVSVMSLLDHGKATPFSVYNTEGGETRFFNRPMKDSKGGHGDVTLQEGFEISSNVAISKAVYHAFSKEPSTFTNYIASLGLNKPLGLPIYGEGRPVVKTPRSKNWYGTSLPWMSIGYEVQQTPLQTLTLYNAVANDGKMVKPLFVSEIREVGNLVQKFDSEIINPQICKPQTLTSIRKMLEGVVERGTATNLKNDLYSIAGKTGTALVASKGNYREQSIYQSTFVGYFPANKPMYSIIVLINNPSKGVYYGSAVSAPVFKEISDKIYARTATTKSYIASFEASAKPLPVADIINQQHLSTLMNLYSSNKNIQIEPDIDSWIKPQVNNSKLNIQTVNTEKKNIVPDVKGMVLSDALYLLENKALKVRFSGNGKVVSQSLIAGTAHKPNDVILLQLN